MPRNVVALSLGLLASSFLAAPAGAAEELTVPEAAARLERQARTGTMLFSKGECLYVRASTCSEYTHVGMIVSDEEGVRVFDSMKGVGVRSLPLIKYLASVEGEEVTVIPPAGRLSEATELALVTALEQELGRPYDVSQFLTGRESDGLHCSQYVCGVLHSAGLVRVKQPADVSPGSLFDGLSKISAFGGGPAFEPQTISVTTTAPIPPPGLSACGECWWETKQCLSGFKDSVIGLFLCR